MFLNNVKNGFSYELFKTLKESRLIRQSDFRKNYTSSLLNSWRTAVHIFTDSNFHLNQSNVVDSCSCSLARYFSKAYINFYFILDTMPFQKFQHTLYIEMLCKIETSHMHDYIVGTENLSRHHMRLQSQQSSRIYTIVLHYPLCNV